MDIGAMKQDLTRCLAALPPGMINPRAVAEWIGKHKPNLEALIPDIIELLKPHVMAGAVESMTGTLDTDEIEHACIEVLLTFGMNIDPGVQLCPTCNLALTWPIGMHPDKRCRCDQAVAG